MPEESWHRRWAADIISQLPPKADDALLVLDAAKRLIADFIGDQPVLDFGDARAIDPKVVSISDTAKRKRSARADETPR